MIELSLVLRIRQRYSTRLSRFVYCYFIREPPHRFQRSISWKRILFRLVKKWYHRCLSICLLLLFHTRGSSQVPEKRNQLFGTTDNLLTHFEWANADEEVFMCLWKEVSVIVARRVLFKRNIMRPIFWRWITSKIYFFLSSAYVKWNWLQTVLTESSCCHELLNSVNDSGVEKLNHFCPWFYVRSPQSAFKLSPTDWRFAFPFKFGFQKLIII